MNVCVRVHEPLWWTGIPSWWKFFLLVPCVPGRGSGSIPYWKWMKEYIEYYYLFMLFIYNWHYSLLAFCKILPTFIFMWNCMCLVYINLALSPQILAYLKIFDLFGHRCKNVLIFFAFFSALLLLKWEKAQTLFR